jgi:hypothetical protein
MKPANPNPSPIKPFLGLSEDGSVRVFVSPFPLHQITPMHWRDSDPPTLDKSQLEPARQQLTKLEKYFEL